MAASIPSSIRDLIRADAYLLSIKHYKQSDIAEALSKQYGIALSRQAVNGLIREQRVSIRTQMDETTVQQHLDEYIDTNRSVAHDAWKRLAQTKANAQNVPGLQSNILTAAKNTATALGLLTGKGEAALPSEVTVKHEFDFSRYDELFAAAAAEPIEGSGPRLLTADGTG